MSDMAIFGRTLTRPEAPDVDVLRTQLLRPVPGLSPKFILIVLATVAILYWGIVGSEASPAELIDGLPNIWDFLTRLMPPEFEHDTKTLASPGILFIPSISSGISYPYPTILDAIFETIQMAIV